MPLILLIFAFVFFVIGAASIPTWRINMVSAGLACWVLSTFVGHL